MLTLPNSEHGKGAEGGTPEIGPIAGMFPYVY